jgi:hypothetical protein
LKAQRKKESSNVIEDAYQCGVNALSSSDKIESNEGNKEDGEKSLYALYAKQNAETLHLSIQR